MALPTRKLPRSLPRPLRQHFVRGSSASTVRDAVTVVTNRCGAILLAVLLTFAMSPSWCCCALRESLNAVGTTVAQAQVPPCCAARVARENGSGERGQAPTCPRGGSNRCPCKIVVLKAPCTGLGGTTSVLASTLAPPAFALVAISMPSLSSSLIRDAEAIHWRHGPPRVSPDPVSTHCKIVV